MARKVIRAALTKLVISFVANVNPDAGHETGMIVKLGRMHLGMMKTYGSVPWKGDRVSGTLKTIYSHFGVHYYNY